eukprot:SAG11_NODE_1554_length_4695_cov_1.527633_2_plen_195_part_00
MPHAPNRVTDRLANLLTHLRAPYPTSRRQPSKSSSCPPSAEPAGRWNQPVQLPNGEMFEPAQDQGWTTRPELRGTFGMVASSEYLASAAGMRALELGGNAFDAAIATGLCLWHTECGNTAPGAECAITFYAASTGGGQIMQCSGQGRMPMSATPELYAERGVTTMPAGGSLLSACTPGAYDAYMLLLAKHGSMR